jgi:hypothetical protein
MALAGYEAIDKTQDKYARQVTSFPVQVVLIDSLSREVILSSTGNL